MTKPPETSGAAMRRAVLSLMIGTTVLGATGGLLAQNPPWPAPPAAARSTFGRFAGIYRLTGVEPRGATGQGLARNPQTGHGVPRGYLAYDPAGFMSVTIQWSDRPRFAAGQPTPDEARTAMDGYTAYWGTFAVNEAAGTLTHQTFGALQPRISGTDLVERFILAGNRLTLRAPAAPGAVQRTLIWERLPDLPNLTPVHRQLIGFWKLISTERRNMKGELVRAYPGWTGFIVYSASGHMLVHMSEPYRRRPVGDAPTPEEAMAAYRNYTSYFGTYTIDDSGRYLVHHVEGSVNPGSAGTDTQRFFEISGKQLILRPPPIKTPDGEVIMTNIWERVLD
jgi:hypothetical protein